MRRVPGPRPARGRDPAGGVALGRRGRRRAAGAVEARGGAEVEAEQEARHPPRLGPVAGRREGDRDGARVARPDVGPAVAGAGRDGAGAAVGQCPQHEQRARVEPPRPAGRPGRRARRAGAGDARATIQPPIGQGAAAARPPTSARRPRTQSAVASPRTDLARAAERRDAARWFPAGSAGGPSRRARAAAPLSADRRTGDDPGVGRHGARRLPLCRARRSAARRPGPAPAGRRRRRRRRPPAVSPPPPSTATPRNGGGSPGSAAGRPRVGRRAPGDGVPPATAISAASARRCTSPRHAPMQSALRARGR